MILVSRQEADEIRRNVPQATISITMRQRSKRKKYYVEESLAVLKFLKEYNAMRTLAHFE